MATVSVDKCPRCQSPRVTVTFKSTSCSYYSCSECGYLWDIDVASDGKRKNDWPDEVDRRVHYRL
jgi:transposase-like protein